MSYRDVTPEDTDLLEGALCYFYSKVLGKPNKEWVDDIDPEFIVGVVLQGKLPAVIVDEAFLLIYVVTPFWLNPSKKVFQELALIRLARTSNMLAVADAMQAIAEANGCCRIFMDTSLARNDSALTRQMARYGYSPIATQLTKPLKE